MLNIRLWTSEGEGIDSIAWHNIALYSIALYSVVLYCVAQNSTATHSDDWISCSVYRKLRSTSLASSARSQRCERYCGECTRGSTHRGGDRMSLQLSMCNRLSRFAVRFIDWTLPSMSSEEEEEEEEGSASTIPTPLTACACSWAAISLRHDFTLKQVKKGKRYGKEKKRGKVKGGHRADWRTEEVKREG